MGYRSKPMMNFCTYFDSYYMIKGLALYLSLNNITKNSHLYVMAFDKDCFNKLKHLNLENMTVELLDDFVTPELLAVKPTRSRGEYCWTCGPSVIYHFLTKYNLDDITYLDSDLFFMSDPYSIVEEIGNNSVAITEQGISEKNAKIYGKYCVQYMFFRNDKDGLGALTWWKDSCIEWCFQKLEPTRYGDQKYLDEFPLRWNNVHVIRNLGAGIAPWNMDRYTYEENYLSYRLVKYPYIFFHMHGMKIEVIENRLILSSLHGALNTSLIEKIFMPYATILKDALMSYLGYKIDSVVIHDMPLLKKVEYRIRGFIRGSSIVQWLYFDVLKRKDTGHGTKL